MDIDFPFHVDGRGRVANVDYATHVRQMIEQVLFTMEGERVNRPDFGCGLGRMLFEAATSEVIAATQATVQGALQRWLGDLIHVQGVKLTSIDSEFTVTVRYLLLNTGEFHAETFVR